MFYNNKSFQVRKRLETLEVCVYAACGSLALSIVIAIYNIMHTCILYHKAVD